jgi:hypothetical protein
VWNQSGSVANFDFRGKIRKLAISTSMTYRHQNSRKSNFATEPFRTQTPSDEICEIQDYQMALTKNDEDPTSLTSVRNDAGSRASKGANRVRTSFTLVRS